MLKDMLALFRRPKLLTKTSKSTKVCSMLDARVLDSSVGSYTRYTLYVGTIARRQIRGPAGSARSLTV